MFKALDLGGEKRIGRILLRFSKCVEGLVIFHYISFLSWIQIVKVLGVIHANFLRPGALGILVTKYFSSNVLNLLDQRTVDAPSVNAFESRLCYIRDNWVSLFTD